MKKILTIVILFIATIGFAQNSGITYQAVIYGPNGQQLPGSNNQQYILANKTICLRFSIIDQTGTVEYQETIVTTTDKFGMVNLLIGTGTQVSGYAPNFAGIVWNANTKSLKVELDPSQNCQNFTQISNNPFTYVPFAYYSANPGEPGPPGPAGPTGPQGLQGVAGTNGSNGAQGIQGLQGPIGLTGPAGPQGIQGLTGPAGTTGPQGPIGLTGVQGPQGPIGLTGPQGPQGNPGTNGINGVDGATGPQGPIGLTGAQGPQGNPGTNGINGVDGATGPQGPIGLTGAQGPQGIPGTNGINGVDGAIGPQGPIGLTGPAGTNGSNGLSAYQIWLNAGNTGTEAQFLNSLQGATGPAGTNGVDGVDGATGPQGLTGTTGAQGPAGTNGTNGTNGQNGLSAYQIWLNAGNTGTEAQFLTSLQGATGPAGTNGINGVDGATGPQGIAGITGAQGPTGLLSNGTDAGNTPYWNGTQWVVNNSNIHNNGAGVGIGTTSPNTSAKLEISSSTQGFLPPRMTTTQRDAIASPAIGLVIYNTSTNCLNFFIGSGWNETCGNPILPSGTVTTINCGTATNTGNLTQGTAASGISSSIPYTGGNGGSHSGQTVTSTGVTGLTATLSAGTFTSGAGSLVYSITGTPSSSGTASFALNIGGQTCTLNITVANNLVTQYPVGSVFCASGPTAIVDVTNPTTGKIWMDRNLGASQAATSSTDVNSYGDLYQWGRASDGHQCRISTATGTLSSSDQAGHGQFIINNTTPVDWRNPQNTNLWQGVNGINNPCPTGYRLPTETELNAELLSWNTANSLGAFSSPLKLPIAGWRNSGGAILVVGSTGLYWSSSVFSTSSRNFSFGSSGAVMSTDTRAFGVSVRCIKDGSAIIGTVNSINCGTATNTGSLTQGTAASSASSSVPYTGGNGGSHSGQTVTSTGVTGLTATVSSGTFANGNGTLVYSITGTPSTSGTASFAISIGGQTCTLSISVAINLANQYPVGSVFCASGPTAIVDVTNPTTGKIWMDRNLGASRAATSSTDVNSYGDLYQWGRGNDGHQCRNSLTTTTLSSTDQPGNNRFIVPGYNDWRTPSNSNLWQGVNSINNPCPTGYRIPTQTELSAERLSWNSLNSNGAFASPLKFSMGGYRSQFDGSIYYDGSSFYDGNIGFVWSNTFAGSDDRYYLDFNATQSNMSINSPSSGRSVRCIKDASAITGTLGSINCGSATNTGTLTQGTAASGVSSSVPYTGGNGGSHSGQTVTSTGVTGLTATLSSGTFANGNGTLVYNISGTPSASGTASFALNIGGQTCALNLSVAINLVTQYPAGSVFCASGPTAIVDVTNPTTGKIWMDRNLGASQAATSSTDVNSYGDLYQWGRGSDGHQCRNSATTTITSSTSQPNHRDFILSSEEWGPPTNSLWQGVNGINNPCPSGYRIPTEAELDTERSSWSTNNPIGAFSSPLKLPVAGRRRGDNLYQNVGTGAYYISSTILGSSNPMNLGIGTNSGMIFSFKSYGISIRCIKDASAIIGTVNSINCGTATNTGTLTQGTAASGVSSSVPYTGGNGGSHSGQTVTSTGVAGLTATLSSGTFANGNGTLVYNISGTPSASGTASFALNIGGQTCALNLSVAINLVTQYPAGSVFCASGPTAIVDITNPVTGKTWMDRNLGASQVATSSTDALAYGDLYQWGRGPDGHQCRNSGVTSTLSSTDQPGNGNFIITSNTPNDWRSNQNDNLWQGINGINNPCPTGYRLPTETEINTERLSWSQNNSTGAFASPLKLPMAGNRDYVDGSLITVGTFGYYWSSTVNSRGSHYLYLFSGIASVPVHSRPFGFSVRCIKE
jgi:uncharacterized protein (TIGR02145 family)